MAAEKPAKPADGAPAAADEKPKKGGMMKMLIVAAVVLVLEGVTVGVTMMISAGPKKVIADVPATAPAEAVVHEAEVKLVDARLPNNVGGRLYLYDLAVVVKVDEKNKVKVTELFADREAETKDHIRAIVASSDPKALAEPGLETLRRQIAYQLDETLGKDGKGMIKEVLIPKCTPMRAEY
jgi:flagellar basal body-associated protein FliL